MFSPLEWLMAVLRVKTICWEIFEREGIRENSKYSTQDSQFSTDCNYIKYYKKEVQSRGSVFLDEVYLRFCKDADILTNKHKVGIN